MTTIDHAFFPHVFDAILSAAPHEAMLALRATSLSNRRRMDRVLASHLVLTGRGDSVAVGSPLGLVPGFRQRKGEVVMSTRDLERDMCFLRRIVVHVRVLDLCVRPYGKDKPRIAPEPLLRLARQMANLSVVRLCPGASSPGFTNTAGAMGLEWPASCPIKPRTLVAFTALLPHPSLQGSFLPPATRGTEGVKRVVVHISSAPGHRWLPSGIAHGLINLAPSVREVVVTLSPVPGDGRPLPPTAGIEWELDLPRTIAYAMSLNRHAKWTLVGLDDIDPDCLRCETCRWTSHSVKSFLAEAAGDCPQAIFACSHDEELDVAYLSRDEYRASVGEEQFRLETVE